MDLNARIERLEAQNRRLRAGLVSLALVAAAGASLGARGAAIPDVVQARRFQVVDAEGTVLAMVGAKAGHGVLALADASGNWRVQTHAQPAGGAFELRGPTGKSLVVVGADADGNGSVVTHTRDGAELVSVGSSAGRGAVLTYDGSGQEHVKIATTHDGAGSVTTFDAEGRRLIELTSTTAGQGVIAVFEPSGRVRASWP